MAISLTIPVHTRSAFGVGGLAQPVGWEFDRGQGPSMTIRVTRLLEEVNGTLPIRRANSLMQKTRVPGLSFCTDDPFIDSRGQRKALHGPHTRMVLVTLRIGAMVRTDAHLDPTLSDCLEFGIPRRRLKKRALSNSVCPLLKAQLRPLIQSSSLQCWAGALREIWWERGRRLRWWRRRRWPGWVDRA